jgi:PAS domain S-box-containing protein
MAHAGFAGKSNWTKVACAEGRGVPKTFGAGAIVSAPATFLQSCTMRLLEALRPAVCGALLMAALALACAAEPQRVVVLYDERPDLPGLKLLDASLVGSLTAGVPQPPEVFRESMDLSRLGADRYPALLREHLRAKYAGKRIDAVVAVMDPALAFVLDHQDTLFPGTPVVFAGVERRTFAGRTLPAHVTGVFLKRVFAPTLEIALQLHPDTRQVVVVAGTSEFDQQVLADARAELRPHEERLELSYLTSLPLPELLGRLSRLPPRSLVLYTTLFRDGAGDAFVPHDVARRISAASSAPVYGFIDQFLGLGVVGGHLYSLEKHGEEAARLTSQVLAGTSPKELPPVEPAASRTMFDARQLQRWSIDEARLPSDAAVLFREPSLWREYRSYAIAAISVVALQALLIGGLLLQRGRRLRAEARLSDSEQLHRLTLRGISDAVLVTTPEGALTFVSPGVRAIFGCSVQEALRLGSVSRLLGHDLFEPAALETTGEISNIERRIVDRDGHERHLLVSVKRAAIGQGTLLYTCRDVTDRRRAEDASRALAHAQRLAGMGELTGMIAHEINQPLAAILSNAQAAELLLQRTQPPLAELREIVSDIQEEDMRADATIRRIRSLMGRHEIQMQPLDLNDAVTEVLRLTASDASRREVRIRSELAPRLPAAWGDRVHLQQVLLNLVINAMDAMRGTPAALREVTVRTQAGSDGGTEVEVADRGPGIPADRLSRIFQSFYTTKSEGMGLGLAIASSIVLGHGGRIWAENRIDGGAVFHFTLPPRESSARDDSPAVNTRTREQPTPAPS